MRTDISKEAVSIDGQFIEDLLPGYKTIKTSGRETLAPSLETTQVGKTDGEVLRNARYSARTIEVEFVLQADSMNNLRRKLEHLNNILTAEERDFVFNDEDNRYYTGVPRLKEDGTDLHNGFTGKFEIYCAYPFKRSNEVFEVTGVKEGTTATFDITYNGTYPAKPVLVAEFAGALSGGNYSDDGDCGYVLFVDSNENIIQLGNPDAVDLDGVSRAGQLINRQFSTLSGWGQTGVAWDNKVVDGSVSVGQISDANWNKGSGQTLSFAKPTYGGNTTTWHGPVLRTALSNGSINFDISLVHRICCKETGEYGTFECGAYNNQTMVAGFIIAKHKSGTLGDVRYIINGQTVGKEDIDLSYYNQHFGYCNKTAVYKTQYYDSKKKKWKDTKIKKAKTRKVVSSYTYTQSNLNSSIKKAGSTVTFKIGNLAAKTFTVATVENMSANAVSFHFGCYQSSKRLNTNAVSSIKMTSHGSAKFADTPNVFTAGDIVEADCYDASVTLRRMGTAEGQLAPQYGALGNNWEGFELRPGANAIAATWSSWLTNPAYTPTLKILYNEVFI